MTSSLAPIILFVYNRPWHTRQTIEALQKNEFASESELFIYSDAPKNDSAIESVSEVRNYIKTITGFKTVTILERETNWGLAANIIDGVTEIINHYGSVIVLEDDLITSPFFLTFMNNALAFYRDQPSVWHISAWNYPISAEGLEDTFLSRTMNCWGWATWADRWQYYEKNTDRLIREFSWQDICAFNLDDIECFWNQVLENQQKKINTWAIYWYATIFQKNGLCCNPAISYVQNIGHDGSGVHCGANDFYDNTIINHNQSIQFAHNLEESDVALQKIKQFYRSQKKSFAVSVINKVSRLIHGKNFFR